MIHFLRLWIGRAAAAAVLMVACESRAAGLTLAENHKSRYQITIASNAIPSERYAAEELQRYFESVSGVKLPIKTDVERAGAREILLGDNGHLRKLGIEPDKMGAEDFVLLTKGDRLIIAGGKPRGTLYGVYSLLEERLGIRWFTPEVEWVPTTNQVVLPALEETHIPVLEYREVSWTEMARNADFAARHRLNGQHYALTAKHGGRAVVYHPFVHSMEQLVPPGLYEQHPEYFPLVNGKRLNGYVQRCLSNPDVLKLAFAQVRRWLEKQPETTIVSVSQNDTAKWCQCEQCQALDEAEGSPSASMIRFVNAIAENIEKDYPSVKIDTLAYQYTRKPPKTLRPRANVIVRLCSIECCFAHPFDTCGSPENRRFCDDLAAWQPVVKKLYVWDYSPNFAHYQQPFPNFEALQPDVRVFIKHGVKGIFNEGNYSGGGNGEMGPLRAYVLAELLWNPEMDMQRATTEFCRAYYGQAAPQILAYLDSLEAQVRDGKRHARIYDKPSVGYLNEAFLSSANKLFDKAEQSAESDAIKLRVLTARLPLWYVELATKRLDGEARAERLNRFLEVARKAGISNISEGKGLDIWAQEQSK